MHARKKIGLFLRYFIGCILLASAIGKLLDNRGFAAVIETYQLLPTFGLLALGLSISLFELFLGINLIVGKFLVPVAFLSIVMHLVYALLACITILRGIELENCGCFGVFLVRPLGWNTVIEDIVLSALCFLLYFCIKKQPAT